MLHTNRPITLWTSMFLIIEGRHIKSLDFGATWFLMELVRSANTDGINECRLNFNFLLPTWIPVIENRKAIFESKFVNFNSLLHYYGISAYFGICKCRLLNVCIVRIILSHYCVLYSHCVTILVTVRPMLRYRCPVYMSYLYLMLVYCGQTVGWIKMPLGTEIGLRLGDTVLDGDSPRKGAQHPTFLPILFGPVSIVAKRSPISAYTAELLFFLDVPWCCHCVLFAINRVSWLQS